VQKNVPFVFEKRFAEILLQAPSTYSVGYSQFGQFLKDQFDKMGKGGTDTKQLLMTTGNHALLLTLKRKVEKAEVKCVIELYDPNKTSHVRCVEASEHITNLSMANFLSVSHSDRERYLGNEQVVQCNELPEALGLNKPDQPLYDVPPKRQLTAYLGSAEERHPSRFYHLFEGGLPLDGMQKAFNECTSKREKLALLAAKNSDGIPGLCMAMQNGCTDTVKAYIAIVRQAVENQEITIVEAVELLAAKNTRGIPGLFMAMQNDHQGVVKAFIEGLRDFKLGSHLVVDLLAVKNRNGTPALDVGTEAVSAVFIEGVRMLVKDRVLSASQAAKLMS
jgi:hypothetical protein